MERGGWKVRTLRARMRDGTEEFRCAYAHLYLRVALARNRIEQLVDIGSVQ